MIEFTINNQNKIDEIEQIINNNSRLIDARHFNQVLAKKIEKENGIIDGIADRFFGILARKDELAATNGMNNLDSIEHQEFTNNQILQSTQTNDNEIDIINNSMYSLTHWLKKNTFNVIFDSNIDVMEVEMCYMIK